MTNITDTNEFLSRKRRADQLADGVYHHKTYKATHTIDDEWREAEVHIEVYAGREPGLCISFGNDSRLITLTRAESVQLAKDIWTSIE
ncbi:MAG: hypothetical protein K2Y09_10870 [Nitrosomonas sp.]|jgi:hypothetical protein|uniref:hypothetical protein n=1 Tax=Nitrosomonas sp. TaxID=42353 RepID=UPI001D749436|nr:hypothetical protein [Nitrosomonas sp.]MBX9895663.1 hypothetical protein [Nitrosomonas sp.]